MQTFPVFRNPLHGAIGTVIVLTMCEKIPCSSGTLNTCNLSRAIYKFKSLTHCICTPRGVTLDTNSFEDEDDHEGKIWLKDFFAYSQKWTLRKASFYFFSLEKLTWFYLLKEV